MFSMRTIQTLCIYIYHPQTNCSSLQLVEFADQFAHGGTRKDSRCGHEDFIAGSRHADALVAAKGAMAGEGHRGVEGGGGSARAPTRAARRGGGRRGGGRGGGPRVGPAPDA